jgi:chromosome segregation ATPase
LVLFNNITVIIGCPVPFRIARRLNPFLYVSFSHIYDSVLQIEHKQLTLKLSRQEEQNESLSRQLEQLNAENGDLQHRTTELTSNFRAMQLERDTLQQSLKESSEKCSKLHYELSSITNFDEGQKALPQTPPSLTVAGLDVMGKENAVEDSVEIESRNREVVNELQARISDSSLQISKLIDRLSLASSEKAVITTKLESVTHELSVMRETVETQKTKISQLETSIELLTVERDVATSLLTEVSAGNLALSSLSSKTTDLMSVVDEKSKELLSVEVEKVQALGKVSTLEDIVKELQDNSKCLMDELASSKSETSMLLSQLELANPRPIEDEDTNDVSASILDSGSPNVINEYEVKINALQSEINSLKCARELSAIQVDSPTLPQITIEEDQKLNAEMTELRDYNVALQEAIQGNQSWFSDLSHLPFMHSLSTIV